MDEKSIRIQRIEHIKDVKRLARKMLDANIVIHQTRKNTWERGVNNNNIVQLKSIINKVNKDLHERSVHEYVKNELSKVRFLESKNHFLSHPLINNTIMRFKRENEIFEVLRYSPNYSIVYDLYWIDDGTVGEQMDLAYGEASPDVYEKYCPAKLDEITTHVLPYISNKPGYEISAKILKSVAEQFDSNIYVSTNILLITVAESMVRQLCRDVYKQQNPFLTDEEVDKYIDGKQSIETLITNDDWVDDVEIDVREAYLQSKYIEDSSLKSAVELIDRHKLAEHKIREQLKLCIEIGKKYGVEEWDVSSKVDGEIKAKLLDYQQELKIPIDKAQEYRSELISTNTTIKTSIRVKLQFLVRRFKEDRNSIIHGNYTDFDKGWKSYIYLAAIMKISHVIRVYDEIYG